jgi:hypothetical protein
MTRYRRKPVEAADQQPSWIKLIRAAIGHLDSQAKYIADDRQAFGHNADARELLVAAIAKHAKDA